MLRLKIFKRGFWIIWADCFNKKIMFWTVESFETDRRHGLLMRECLTGVFHQSQRLHERILFRENDNRSKNLSAYPPHLVWQNNYRLGLSIFSVRFLFLQSRFASLFHNIPAYNSLKTRQYWWYEEILPMKTAIKGTYLPGMRIRLIRMDDVQPLLSVRKEP